MKREFLLLANNFDPERHGVASWFMSQKLDGMRAFWDGGVTRGKWADEIPWCNTDKDGRLLERRLATGLWTRYGHPIHAPDWFLDKLPPVPLDGELYKGLQSFQQLVSATKKLIPGPEWEGIQFMVFDSPSLGSVFADGIMNNTNYKKVFRGILPTMSLAPGEKKPFEQVLRHLEREITENEVVKIHRQEQLPFMTLEANARVYDELEKVTAAGGEGLMLRHPSSIWTPERSKLLLKVKKLNDMEGTVTGYIWGRKTALGSKLLGLMGALVLRLDNGQRLELSGFTDQEREMVVTEAALHEKNKRLMRDQPNWGKWMAMARLIGEKNPGEECIGVTNPLFPVGSRVSFWFRELSEAGIPKEARYKRRTE